MNKGFWADWVDDLFRRDGRFQALLRRNIYDIVDCSMVISDARLKDVYADSKVVVYDGSGIVEERETDKKLVGRELEVRLYVHINKGISPCDGESLTAYGEACEDALERMDEEIRRTFAETLGQEFDYRPIKCLRVMGSSWDFAKIEGKSDGRTLKYVLYTNDFGDIRVNRKC